MDEKNCSNLHICQAVDNQSNKCLTEKLALLYPSSDILNQSTINHNQIQTVQSKIKSEININNQLSESFTKEKEDDKDDDKFIAEIELISLIGQRESLPRYRLRVDPCTAFIGYKNKDFKSAARRVTRHLSSKHSTLPKSITELTTVNSELSDNFNSNNNYNKTVEYQSEEDYSEEAEDEEEDESLGLTEEQIENTLDYFILCGLRVSQMTKTYEDLDAITQLLEEKQTDLELAAKIGKNLLERNRDLQSRLIETEKNLCARDEVISQLNHNLSVKDSLLRIFLRDSDQLEDGNDDQTSTKSSGHVSPMRSQGLSTGGDGLSLSSVNFSQLNRKLQDLEEENNILRQERNRLSDTADQLDEHETALVRDCARQLIAANMHIRTLSDELAKKSDAYINQQSEVTRLLTRGLDLESRVKQLTAENEMLVNRLKEAQISQSLLTSELKTSRDKYDECLTLYNEARSEIRALRKRSRRSYFRPGSLISNTSIMNSPTWHHTPSLSSNYLSGIAITPTQSDPDPTSCYNPSSSHQEISDDDDGSSSSLDMLAAQHPGSGNLETTLAADLAHTKMKEYAADNVKHLFRAMEQVRSTRTPSSSQPTSSIDNNHNILLPESGQEDTVSSSGFVSGSEPSENLRKHRSGGSEQVSDSGSPYAGRLLANQNNSPIHSLDVGRRPGSGGYQQQQHQYYQNRSNQEHLLESEKRHSWLGCCDISSNVSEKGYLSSHDYNIKYKNSFDDSLLSCDPDVVGTNQLYYKLPQRLKLIKPLDGSNVLQHWQNLATPSFTRALFDAPLPGVQSRAGVPNTPSNSASNTKITDDNIDDKQRSMSFQPLPLNSINSKYDGLTTYSTFNSPQTQTNVKFPCDSLEERNKISQFGSNSSTCLLNNRIRARSLDHLIMGSPSGTGGGGGGSSYCKDKINESVQFSRAFNHIRLDDSSMTMSPSTASFRTPFSLTSLVSAILPFSVSPQSDDKSSSSVSKPPVASTTSSNTTEPIRLRPKCPLAATGLQGLLDMHKEDSDTSKTLLHRTSSSSSASSKSTPGNQTTSSSSAGSNTPNPQPPTLICPNIVNRPTQYTRPSRGSNLTEITEESGSPPKSQESLSQQLQQQQETQQIHESQE
ncbi:unnamed protein product [Trichobilharzia szidati]|nr:unnamed protein product [Trichobilharzia szidati]